MLSPKLASVTLDEVTDAPGRTLLRLSWECTNQLGKPVMTGGSSGVVPVNL